MNRDETRKKTASDISVGELVDLLEIGPSLDIWSFSFPAALQKIFRSTTHVPRKSHELNAFHSKRIFSAIDGVGL